MNTPPRSPPNTRSNTLLNAEKSHDNGFHTGSAVREDRVDAAERHRRDGVEGNDEERDQPDDARQAETPKAVAMAAGRRPQRWPPISRLR